MEELTALNFLVAMAIALAGSGGLNALVNAKANRRRDEEARKHQVEDRDHAVELAREERDHAESQEAQERYRQQREAARQAHLDQVVDVMCFLKQEEANHASDRHGFSVWHTIRAPKTVKDWPAAMTTLTRVSLLHNDPQVRTICEQTLDSIQSAFVEADDEPDLDDYGKWRKWLLEAVEQIHAGATD